MFYSLLANFSNHNFIIHHSILTSFVQSCNVLKFKFQHSIGLHFETFYGLIIRYSVCYCQFHPSLILSGKARSPHLEWGLLRDSTLVCSGLACKYQSRVKATDRVKHSSLLRYGIIYGCNFLLHRTLLCGLYYKHITNFMMIIKVTPQFGASLLSC